MFRHPHSSQHVRLTTTNSHRLSLYSTPPLWLIVLCLGAKLMTNFLHWPNYKPGNPPLSLPFLPIPSVLSLSPSSIPPRYCLPLSSVQNDGTFLLGPSYKLVICLSPSPFSVSFLPLPSPSPLSIFRSSSHILFISTGYYQQALVFYDLFNATTFSDAKNHFLLSNFCAVSAVQFWGSLMAKNTSPEQAYLILESFYFMLFYLIKLDNIIFYYIVL